MDDLTYDAPVSNNLQTDSRHMGSFTLGRECQ